MYIETNEGNLKFIMFQSGKDLAEYSKFSIVFYNSVFKCTFTSSADLFPSFP